MSLDKQIKKANEERAELIQKAEKISNRSGDLSEDEKEEFDRTIAKIEGLDHHINKLKDREQGRANNATPINGDSGIGGNSKIMNGTPLDEQGKIRLFKPGEEMRAAGAPSESDIDLGSFLRGVIDKPVKDNHRQIIQNSTTSSGYELPSHVAMELINRLRAKNPLLMENGAGARSVSLEGGETAWVKIDSDPTAVWHSELSEETPGGEGFSAVKMDPKSCLAMTTVSNELMQDSSNIEQALTSAFVGSINNALLEATFTGAGSATEPEGLSTQVTETETYTNGGSPDFSNFVNAHGTLYSNNVPEDGRSHLLSPDTWTTLNNLTSSADDQPLRKPFGIVDTPEFTSSGVPTGTSYVGDFSNVVYGFRLNIQLRQFPAAAARSYGTLWVCALRADMSVFRPNALVRIEEAAA